MTSISNTLLTTATKKVTKTKCFPVELYCTNMKPDTKYDFYCDGVLMNAFCKPFGKNLGDQIISDPNGKVQVLFLFNIEYNENFIINKVVEDGLLTKSRVLEFVSPSGGSSKTYMPVIMNPTK